VCRVALAHAVVVVALVATVLLVVRPARHLARRVLVVGVADATHARTTGGVAAALAVLGHATVTGVVVRTWVLVRATLVRVRALMRVRTPRSRRLTRAGTVAGIGRTILVVILAVANSPADAVVEVSCRHVVAVPTIVPAVPIPIAVAGR
jgi:hypothetical protein